MGNIRMPFVRSFSSGYPKRPTCGLPVDVHNSNHPSPNINTIIGNLTPHTFTILQEAFHKSPCNKAPGLDNIPWVLLQHMPLTIHCAMIQLLLVIVITGTIHPTDPSQTPYYYIKFDPYN
jgi:hypothetical protein